MTKNHPMRKKTTSNMPTTGLSKGYQIDGTSNAAGLHHTTPEVRRVLGENDKK